MYFSSDYNSQKTNSKAKEIADYYECLKEAKIRYRFKYILVLEDDAEPSKSNSIEEITYSVIPQVMEEKPEVIFSKLFYSFGYQGFSINLDTLVEITTFYMLTFCLVYGILLLLDRRFSFRQCIDGSNPARLYNLERIVPSLVISLLAGLLVVVLGRQSTLLALKNVLVPYRTAKAHSDQTTAMLYPRTKLNEVMNLLENRFACSAVSPNDEKNEIAIDIQLANVIEKKYNGRNVMIWIQGDFFNHIGYYTSLHFKGLHVGISSFAERYITLPDKLCDSPM